MFLSSQTQKTGLAARLDQAGIAASMLCALHCLSMPLLAGLLPLWGMSRLADESVEWLLVSAALLIGLYSLLTGFLRHHRRWRSLLVFAAGAGMLLLARLGLEEESPLELFGVVTGGVLLATAHALNWHYCRQCCTR